MSDIKIFHLLESGVEELPAKSVAVEKSLQVLIEKNLDALLGVSFLASEYSTGAKHGGRIDTLGIDENRCPVIIEYKRALNENVINQGLFYLDWLLDHKAEFQLLVMKKLGAEPAESISWSGCRLMCIAGDFTKYDQYAVQQINRNIELLRYRRYGDDLLLLELVNSNAAQIIEDELPTTGADKPKQQPKGFTELLAQAPQSLADLYKSIEAWLLALGDDVQVKQLKYYIAFKRLKNFASVEVHPQSQTILFYIKVNPDTITLEPGFTRDVRKIGHYGTGDLEIRIKSQEDFEKAQGLILKSYEAS
jgi:predicted transport protein